MRGRFDRNDLTARFLADTLEQLAAAEQPERLARLARLHTGWLRGLADRPAVALPPDDAAAASS